jgi:hypothetical protein
MVTIPMGRMIMCRSFAMNVDKPLRNAPVSGTLRGEDPHEIERELRGEGKELRITGNLRLENLLDDSLFKGERCVFGFALQK